MANSPVTIATFGSQSEAIVFQHALSVEGIESFLADELTVGMAWHLTNAVGGVKLQVAEQDIERALRVIESHEPVAISDEDWQADGAPDEFGGDSGWDEPEPDDLANGEVANERTENLRRAVICSVLGLLFFPLQIYTLVLLAKVVTNSEPLHRGDRWWFAFALALALAFPVMLGLFFHLISSPSSEPLGPAVHY